tara:strand:- start:122 stop:322 length:201 start_codon:yes stop_codon:yes gene_type:complete
VNENFLQTKMNKMTRLSVKALTLTVLMLGISSQAAKTDVDLNDGIRALICESKAIYLLIDHSKFEK